MSETQHTRTLLLTSAAVICAAVAIAAQAQTVSSPFAKKDKKQAWETQAQEPASPPAQVTSQSAPAASASTAAPAGPPTAQQDQLAGGTAPSYQNPPTQGTYNAPPAYVPPSNYSVTTGPAVTVMPEYAAPETLSGRPAQLPYVNQNAGGAASGAGTYSPAQNGAYYPGRPQAQSGWKSKLGLGSLLTTLSGYLKLGAAATERGDWDADFIADGAVRGEVSAISQSGLEYGAGLELRGQYDKYRRGFGGRVGDCPPALAGCSSTLVGGVPTSVRGHTTQFYASGPDNIKEAEIALEGAYLFLRSGYGDISLGRDDGAAYLFSLGAPSLMSVGASNSSVDYTGLDSVKTINDASGFSEKITYTSPRLLGDTVGVGVQFGASYALDSKACGVDYCVRDNGKDASGALAPDLQDVFEFGVSLDRKFENGLSVEATATYAMASEKSGIAEFDDLKALGLGMELGYEDFILGASYLNSNNGLDNGGYLSWDAGMTWKPSQLGFTLGYGQAKDKNIGLKSDQALFGVSYDWNEHYRLGTGVQYTRRDMPVNVGGIITPTKEEATSIFVEGRVTF